MQTVNESAFFKAYDMRGTFGVDFTLDTAYRVGRALPATLGARRWLVGRDCRETGADVRDALVKGLAESGADVTDIGLCTTPMVYFFTAEDGYDASVMVTASHNPPGDNGLKVSRRGAVPVGFADGLDRVLDAISRPLPPPGAASGISEADGRECLERYAAWQRKATPDSALEELRYAVDCSNGMASLLAHDLFPGAEILNDTPDGRFPAHSPNPLKEEARAQLAALVREKELDCGVIFDGDADRAMFIDEHGGFVQPDYLIPAVFAATPHGPGATVLHDVRTSRGAIEALREAGASPRMVPVGHVFAKREMRECGAACGGELAGHYYFKEFHDCDSGILAARRILSEVAAAKRKGLTFSRMIAPVAGRYANSGELNFRVDDKTAAVARVMAAVASRFPHELSHSRLDGIRYEFAEGWFNIRASNTEPYLRLVAECDTPQRLAEWLHILRSEIIGHED